MDLLEEKQQTDQENGSKDLKHGYKDGDLKRWYNREPITLVALCGYKPNVSLDGGSLSAAPSSNKICPTCFELNMQKRMGDN